jgi:CHAT domain-containing protein
VGRRNDAHVLFDPVEFLGRLAPLLPLLSGITRLTIVPDGKIGLLPLGSLPGPDHRFLLDHFEIGYRFSSRGLTPLRFEEDFGLGVAPAILGAPDYGARTGTRYADLPEDDAFLSQFRSGGRFQPLAEAADECRDIARLLSVDPTTGADATEGALKALASPEILHLSTHGFFLEARGAASPAEPPAVRERTTLDDPLDRAGLAFTGANAFLDGDQPPPGAEDGILYATEVAGLNLMRTDIVSLSACQTGLGDVRSGDGVHGLQRAFTVAGARTVVSSLWEVPDRPTRVLFTRFYEELLKERTRRQALTTAMHELAQEYPAHPVAWGGFVLHGDDAVLSRFSARQLRVASMTLDSRRPAPESPAQQAERLIADGSRLFGEGDTARAIAVFTDAARLDAAPSALRARALYERAGVQRQTGQLEAALTDYQRLDAMDGIPERLRMAIDLDRATTCLLAGRLADAIAAYSRGLAWPGLDADARAQVLVNRGLAHWELGEADAALADMAAVIETPGLPRDQRTGATALA